MLKNIPHSAFYILGISFIARSIIAATLGPGFDEAYYFCYSLHPALSYFDHPPVVAWLSGIFPFLTGQINAFTIRLGAVLLFIFTGVGFYKLSRYWLNTSAALLALVIFNLLPLFGFVSGVMILPDAVLAFFWVWGLIYHKKVWDNPNNFNNWILAGVFTGLAMLSKYHGILLGFGTVLVMVFSQPRQWKNPYPYLYGIVAFMIVSPVIIWNYQNEWISFTFQGGRAFSGNIQFHTFLQAIVGQAAYLTPMAFIPLIMVIARTFPPFKKLFAIKDAQFFFFYGTIPVLLFNGVSLFNRILPHWPMPGYIILIIPFALWLYNGMQKSGRYLKGYRISFAIIIFLLCLAWSHVKYGILTGTLVQKAGLITSTQRKQDATLAMHGWDTVPQYLKEENIQSDSIFLFSHKWFLSGEIMMATEGKYPVACFNETDPRGFGFWINGDSLINKNGIYITTTRFKSDIQEKYQAYFESISFRDSVVSYRGGLPAKTFYFYQCNQLKKNYPNPFSHLK